MSFYVYEPADYEDATYADGPTIYEWLEENGHLRNLIQKGSTVDRQMRKWKGGENPTFHYADRVLLRAFDVFVWELPAEVWRTRRKVTRAVLEVVGS